MTAAQSIAGWEALGVVAPAGLATARLNLHHAANVAAAAGSNLLPARADASHTALSWLASARALVGEALPGGGRAAVRFDPFELVLMNGDVGGPTLSLHGVTVAGALAWLGDALGRELSPLLPAPEPLGPDGTFGSGDADARRELGRWFGDAALAIAPYAALDAGSPIRIWPHHFDIATLLTFAGEGEHARTVGVGLSPGDASYAEPYFYVTPWPRPSSTLEPPLPAGHWHTEGWFGAVLPASSLLARAGDGSAVVASFVADAVAAARAMLER